VIVVIAAREDDVADIHARLGELGEYAVSAKSVGEGRWVVLAAADDTGEAERLAVTLRAEGRLAVVRPHAGPRLEAWMRDTRPIRFEQRLSVCFAWSEHDRAGLPGLIELGPGGFGNGDHPSTRLLIEQLLQRITGGERTLDLGCGSGVLGLCALELGAASLVAIDLKPEAIAATRRNATLNGMDQRVEAVVAPLSSIGGTFDAIVANVGRAAIVELAPQLRRLLAPDGWLAVSGISPQLCSLVAGFLHPLVEIEQRSSGEWAALVVADRSGASRA
jgi:ribosomal protein L11 methyltransferase